MIYLAVFLLILGILLFFLAGYQRNTTGLPGGKIIYADTDQWKTVDKVIFDPDAGLSGKPDYLVRKGGRIIPVEVKSSHITNAPYDSHIFQLAAYCRLVSYAYKKNPPYGIIHYPNRTFRIEYTSQLEKDLLDKLFEMRSSVNRKDIDRSHQAPNRCAGCGYRVICNQSLV